MSWRALLGEFLRDLLTPPPAVGRPAVRHLTEVTMQRYEADLAPPGAADVVKRKLYLKVDGVESVTELPATAATAPFGVEDGKAFEVWVRDVDDAGNESAFDPAGVYSATAIDDIPPPSPGAPTVRHVGED